MDIRAVGLRVWVEHGAAFLKAMDLDFITPEIGTSGLRRSISISLDGRGVTYRTVYSGASMSQLGHIRNTGDSTLSQENIGANGTGHDGGGEEERENDE